MHRNRREVLSGGEEREGEKKEAER